MSRNPFNYILSEIRFNIEKQHTGEEPISPEMRLAICLYNLSRGDYNYTIPELTGVGESSYLYCQRSFSGNCGELMDHVCFKSISQKPR